MKNKLLFIIPVLSLILAGAVFFNLFIRKPENIGKGFDGNKGAGMVIDRIGIFDDDPETLEELNILVDKYTGKLDMNICVMLGDHYFYSDEEVKSFCDSTYDNEYGEDTDGIFYYIDLSGSSSPIDHISTSGKAVLLYQKELEGIFKSIDYYLPSGGGIAEPDDIEGAVKEFFRLIDKYGNKKPGIFSSYHDKENGRYYYYRGGEFIVSKKRPPSSNFIVLIVSAAVGALTGFISYFSIKSKYKFKSGTNSSVYVSREESKLTENSDSFIRSYVTKRKIETSSSGSIGGSGGGSHSSGGGHGGGSHHR